MLGFHTVEVAEMLDASEASVKSALQRARAALAGRGSARSHEHTPAPRSEREREVVGRFADAFLAADLDGLVACSPTTRC